MWSRGVREERAEASGRSCRVPRNPWRLSPPPWESVLADRSLELQVLEEVDAAGNQAPLALPCDKVAGKPTTFGHPIDITVILSGVEGRKTSILQA